MIRQIIDLSLPLALAALGALIAESAGMLNIALEGFVLLGAFSFTLLAVGTKGIIHAPWILYCGTLVISALISLGYSWYTRKSRSNIFITGLGFNLFIAGAIRGISGRLFGQGGVIRFNLPPVHESPTAALVKIFIILGFAWAVWYFLNRTRTGVRIRSLDNCELLLGSRGFNRLSHEIAALTVSGAMAALAGAYLAYRTGGFVANMSGNRGWIALVLIYLGRKSSWGTVLAVFLFSMAETLSFQAQGWDIFPDTLTLALPYLLAIAGLILSDMLFPTKKTR